MFRGFVIMLCQGEKEGERGKCGRECRGSFHKSDGLLIVSNTFDLSRCLPWRHLEVLPTSRFPRAVAILLLPTFSDFINPRDTSTHYPPRPNCTLLQTLPQVEQYRFNSLQYAAYLLQACTSFLSTCLGQFDNCE